MRTRRRRDTDAALQAALDGRDPDDPKVCAIQPIVDVVRASIGVPPDPDAELAAVLEEGLDAGADAAASASDRLVRVGQLGDPGTAVLAGHVDSRTQGRGVFCDLVTLEVGDEILFDTVDGPQTWIVTETTSYDRQELPIEELFSLDGDPNWRMHPPHIAQTPVRPPCCPWMPSCGVSHFLSRGWGEVSAG